MSVSLSKLLSAIPDWLAVTDGSEVACGLSDEEARRRAAVLRGLLRDGRVDPAGVLPDDNLKDVFYALVGLVIGDDQQVGEALAEESDAVYQFLARVEWPDDDLGERRELLRVLADSGLRAQGTSIEAVSLHRRQIEDGSGKGHIGADAAEPSSSVEEKAIGLMRIRNYLPRQAFEGAATLYCTLSESRSRVGLFDDLEYLSGSVALTCGGAARQLGLLAEAETWFERASAHFLRTLDPAPLLAALGFARLCLMYERDRHEVVLRRQPMVRELVSRAGMRSYVFKCDLLRAKSLNAIGRRSEARQLLESIEDEVTSGAERGVAGLVLTLLADLLQQDGEYDGAFLKLRAADELLKESDYGFARGDLKTILGDWLRRQGRIQEALSSLRGAVEEYQRLGMVRWEAYSRLLLAETLLAYRRPQEAEAQILCALPPIEELKIVPEGVAAVALLRESLRRQKADPEALRLLREHLAKQR